MGVVVAVDRATEDRTADASAMRPLIACVAYRQRPAAREKGFLSAKSPTAPAVAVAAVPAIVPLTVTASAILN